MYSQAYLVSPSSKASETQQQLNAVIEEEASHEQDDNKQDMAMLQWINQLRLTDPALLEHLGVLCFETYSNDDLAGYIFGVPTQRMFQLGVHPEHRRQGIATRLLNEYIDAARMQKSVRTLSFDVDRDNYAAVRLCTKLGFTIDWEQATMDIVPCTLTLG